MDLNESIFVGVVSGVLASALILFISAFARKVMIPWYRQIIYRGVDISGEWASKNQYHSGNVEDVLMTIKQKADLVEGIMNIAKAKKGEKDLEMKTYEFQGKIRDRFLQIQGHNSDKKAIGFHSELLEIVGGGNLMRGCATWYSVTNEAVQSIDVSWTRK